MPAGRHRMTKKPNTKPVKRHDPKHIDFVQDYFYGEHKGDAKNSLIAAGYTARYAQSYAHDIVGEHRTRCVNKTLWDLVDAERKKISETYGITEQWVMDGYIRDEEFDPIDLVDPETGHYQTDLRLIPKKARLSMKGMKVRQQIIKGKGKQKIIKQTSHYEFPEKKGNRDSIAKVLGMLRDKAEPANVKIDKIEVLLLTVAGSQAVDELPSKTQGKIE